jgi:RNA polymerase sigma-70 factor (ECF subfamily)
MNQAEISEKKSLDWEGDPYRTRHTLLQKACKNESGSWNELLDIYEGFINFLISKFRGPHVDHEELKQIITIKLWQSLSTYQRKKGSFRTWLGKVARNNIINYLKSEKVRFEHLSHLSKVSDLNKDQIEENEIDQFVDLEWKNYIMDIAMKNIKGSFSENSVNILELSLKGHNNHEISKMLSLKPDSVKVLKSRITQRLIEEAKEIQRKFS